MILPLCEIQGESRLAGPGLVWRVNFLGLNQDEMIGSSHISSRVYPHSCSLAAGTFEGKIAAVNLGGAAFPLTWLLGYVNSSISPPFGRF
jgi:hypothetical protein